MNMDFSLSEALKYNSDGTDEALILYDIMCQYSVNLMRHMDTSPYVYINPNESQVEERHR
jgi:hypothetical protein